MKTMYKPSSVPSEHKKGATYVTPKDRVMEEKWGASGNYAWKDEPRV